MDGKGFMVTEEPYKTYLAVTENWVEVCKARICPQKNLMPQCNGSVLFFLSNQ